MTFSIVIPVYNGEKYLEGAILSALNQSRNADEIIIMDDNSTDLSSQISNKYSNRVKYHFNEDGPSGFVNGWNKAVSLASCDYVSILHQDDILYPTFLENVEFALFKNPDAKHLFSLCDYISSTGELLVDAETSVEKTYKHGEIIIFSGSDYVNEYQKTYSGLVHIHRCPGVVTHRSIFDMGCYYNPKAGHIADDDFFYRVGQYTAVIGVMKSLAGFRIHSESATGRISDTSLVKRLGEDYLFQVIQWKESEFIKGDNFSYFVNNSYKYSNRLFAYGVKSLNLRLITSAIMIFKSLYSEGFKNPRRILNLMSFTLKI